MFWHLNINYLILFARPRICSNFFTNLAELMEWLGAEVGLLRLYSHYCFNKLSMKLALLSTSYRLVKDRFDISVIPK